MTRPPGWAPPVWLAIALAAVSGGLAAAQARVNADLGIAVGEPLVAAVVSFGSGLVVMVGLVASRPGTRAALRRTLRAGLPWWTFLGGVGGAAFVALSTFTVPVVGVALFTVAQVAGATMGALGADRVGLGPAGRQRVTAARLGGAALAVAAVVTAQYGRLDVAGTGVAVVLAVLGLVMLIGAGSSVQSALNGRLNVTAADPVAPTAVNFVTGTSVLVVALAGTALVRGVQVTSPPPQPWIYLGGIIGVAFILTNVICVAVLGVLRLTLCVIAGQIAVAILIDTLRGQPVTMPLVGGAILTVAAVVLAGRRPSGSDTPQRTGVAPP